ncbi:MmcQ/YjbR family DNA-binding protein [Catenulispora sp. NL8]|uniref:MmcQ/YjbR family DNA-binding protein n=1 Tax=Catenulispora pinistramenti TaxID=2705254 RepID=A0ABS5KRE7_9ACTN|nr:MmcQ/YjbR family DNA-binding protein [Catenulispora pinistramenti]MBS2548628.1 MmcQ/YjbR family DNA-binding protein [Catenulispora pinistramenti]
MTPNELKKACLALHRAVEDFPFGSEASVFKVAGKVFAITRLAAEPLAVSLKSDPELALSLRAAHAAIRPGYHLNKRHWNTVTIDGSLSRRMVVEMIEDSYDLVVKSLTRAQRAALEG